MSHCEVHRPANDRGSLRCALCGGEAPAGLWQFGIPEGVPVLLGPHLPDPPLVRLDVLAFLREFTRG